MSDGDKEVLLEKKEVEEIVKNDFGEGVEVVNYSVRGVSDTPMGFLGEHYFVEAEITVNGSRRRLKYFMKMMPIHVPEHRDYAVQTRAFYKEVEIYKTLFLDLKTAQSGVQNATKWRPEFYYSRGEDLIVLEELMSQGYYMYPERQYMDEDHLKASLRALAAMHAASLIFEEKYNDGKMGTLSPSFVGAKGKKATVGEIYSHLTFETEASDVKGHPGNNFHEAGIGGPVKMVEYLSGYSEEQKQLIKEKLPDVMRLALQLVKTSSRFKNVFVHGDLWANNLLFRKEETGELHALIIDFQLARYAPPAQDIMMLLHFVQSKEYLQENQSRLFEYYYSALEQELNKSALSAEILLPRQSFLDSCEFYNDLGLTMKLYFFQLILAPPEITAIYFSDPALYTQNLLNDRTQMVIQCFLEDDIYRERLTGALNDAIARFIIPPK